MRPPLDRSARRAFVDTVSNWARTRAGRRGRLDRRTTPALEWLEGRVVLSLAPTVTGLTIGGLTASGATLSATVNPNGAPTNVAFQYSTSPSFPLTPQTIGSGFNQMGGVAADAEGDVFVADTGNNAVEEVLPGGIIKTIGSGFNAPEGVAVDPYGDVWVADTGNNALKEIHANGTITTFGTMLHPTAVAVDLEQDTVYVTDFGLEPAPSGFGELDTVSGLGNGGNAVFTRIASFIDPVGVAVHTVVSKTTVTDVYVADAGAEAIDELTNVNLIDTLAIDETTIASGFVPGGITVDDLGILDSSQSDAFFTDATSKSVEEFNPADGAVTTIASGFNSPGGLAAVTLPGVGDLATIDQVYVADAGRSAVEELTQNETAADGSLTFGPVTTFVSGFNGPGGVAVDGSGDVFAADTGNNAVKEVLAGGAVTTIASGFNAPAGVAVDGSGDVFVADSGNQAIEEVMPGGTVTTIASGLNDPTGVAVDGRGDVFIADSGSQAINEVPSGGTIETLFSPQNNTASPGIDDGVYGLALDTAGDIFFSDGVSRVQEREAGGAIVTLATNLDDPTGVAVDASGDVFVADAGDNAVDEIPPGGTPTPIGSGFNGPTGVAVDGAGDVIVHDTGNNRIVALAPASVTATASPLGGTAATAVVGTLLGLVPGRTYYVRAVGFSAGGTVVGTASSFTTLAPPSVTTGAASAVTGTGATLSASINPNGAPTTVQFQYSTAPSFPGVVHTLASGFQNPVGVAVDAAGDVYVADEGNSTLTELQPNGTSTTIALGFGPGGVAVDASGDIFVTDPLQSVIEERRPGGTITFIDYNGLLDPTGVAVDASGDLIVSEGASVEGGNPAVAEVLADGAITTLAQSLQADTSGAYAVAVNSNGEIAALPGGSSVAEVGFGGIAATIAGSPLPTQALPLETPVGVAVDNQGDVFVADVGAKAVFEVTRQNFTSVITTVVSGFAANGVAVDSQGDLFVTDANNGSVVEVSPPSLAAAPAPLTGTTATPVSGVLSGLSAATTYYYRAVAASPGGTVVDSSVQSFTTPATTSFAQLTGNTITYGSSAVDLSGQVVIMPNDAIPAGNVVTITVDGVTQTALLNKDGTFQADLALATAPGVGASPYPISLAFTPKDFPSGISIPPVTDTSQSLIVTQATPSASVNGPVNATYGTPLGSIVLTGTTRWTVNGSVVSVPGTFAFTGPPTTVLGAGNGQTESVTFSATDSTDYALVTTSVIINVAQAQPAVTIGGPSASVYGQPVTFTATVGRPTGSGGTPTGSVAFYDGSNPIGTGTLSGGTATFALATLGVGGQAITAQYLGDANFLARGSTGLLLTVAKDSTSLSVVTTASPTPLGEPVTFTATLSPAAPGTLTPGTGTVQFTIDGHSAGAAVAVSAGVATYTTSALDFGTHTVKAAYADTAGNYVGSTGSLSPAQVISAAQTSTSLAASTTALVYSQSVTFTATVAAAGAAPTPTGSAKFYVDNVLAATVSLTGGTASYSTSALTGAGSPHAVFVNYIPSGNFLGSTSAAQSVTVAPAATTTAVSASGAPAYPGQTVTITATVAAPAPAPVVPAGTVDFYLDGGTTVWKTAKLNASGVASLSVTNLPVGAHTVSAAYAGTSNFGTSSTATPASVAINPAPTSITLGAVPATTTYGTPVTLTASVTSTDTLVTLTGHVQFYDNGVALKAAVALSGGTATLNLAASALVAGTHSITAAFLGDTNFAPSSPTAAQPIAVSSASTSVSASDTTSGTKVTFSGSVADTAQSPATAQIPAGSIEIMEGTTVLGTVSLSATGTFTKSLTLAVGNQTITILYVPDTNALGQTNFAGSSTTLKVTA